MKPFRRTRALTKDIWHEAFQPIIREVFINERAMKLPMTGPVFSLVGNLFRLGKVPFIKDRFAWLDPEESNVSWLPINEDIQGVDNIALPEEVLFRLIDKATHHVIMDFCPCRTAIKCEHYPAERGCLFMGESALKIPEKSRRQVSRQEAKQHVKKAVAAGLIPVTGKARLDADLMQIRHEGKLLTTCFCCECCCITRYMKHVPPQIMDGFHPPVEGLRVEVTQDCNGCGACESACYIEAISIEDGKARMSSMCRVCGRCAGQCPQEAIKLILDNDRAVEDVLARIEAVVDF